VATGLKRRSDLLPGAAALVGVAAKALSDPHLRSSAPVPHTEGNHVGQVRQTEQVAPER
jgi:hypothetical protein